MGKVDFDDDVEEDSKMGKLQAEHFELSRGTAGGERGEWAAANGARAQGHCLHTKEGSNSKCFDLRPRNRGKCTRSHQLHGMIFVSWGNFELRLISKLRMH